MNNDKTRNLLSWVAGGQQHTQIVLRFLETQGVRLLGWVHKDQTTAILELNRRAWFAVWDNGGEIGVEEINTRKTPRMIPYTANGVAIKSPETVAYRIFAAMRGDEIDWELTIDIGSKPMFLKWD